MLKNQDIKNWYKPLIIFYPQIWLQKGKIAEFKNNNPLKLFKSYNIIIIIIIIINIIFNIIFFYATEVYVFFYHFVILL